MPRCLSVSLSEPEPMCIQTAARSLGWACLRMMYLTPLGSSPVMRAGSVGRWVGSLFMAGAGMGGGGGGGVGGEGGCGGGGGGSGEGGGGGGGGGWGVFWGGGGRGRGGGGGGAWRWVGRPRSGRRTAGRAWRGGERRRGALRGCSL